MKALNDYIRPHVRELAREGALISVPTRCSVGGCGALVRYVGERDTRGAWHCPVCGMKLPYVFWSLRGDHEYHLDRNDPQLVIQLAAGHCEECGEANPPCRCDRSKQDGQSNGAVD